MDDHDSGYRQLFSHPEMVRDLLTGFVWGLSTLNSSALLALFCRPAALADA